MLARVLKLSLCGLVLALFVVGTNLARAQEEETAEPAAEATAAPRIETAHPAPLIPALVVPSRRVAPAAQAPEPKPGPPKVRKYFPYTVRPGDTLGKVAASFGVPLADLARLNHIHEDEGLFVGDILEIPNPFQARSKALEGEVGRLSTAATESNRKLEAAQAKMVSLAGQNAELLAENSALKSSADMLPWWRGTALGVIVAGLLMFGITLLTLFEWWALRRRFLALSDLTQSLTRLDVKYKEMLAKAELRMQQLYGRRGGVGGEHFEHGGKSPEEIEIERLGRELKQTLEKYLERLGARARNSGRRSRWDETLGDESPVGARSARH